MSARFCVSAITVTMALALAPSARGQDAAPIAEALFRDAHARLAEGKVHEACDLFARSQKVQPALGTLLNLAACHEKEGKTATAWAEFQEAMAGAIRAGDKQREAFAKARIGTVEKDLHRVVIEILEPVPAMQVKLDGAPLVREAWGTALPLDPGEHSIEVTAEGYAPWLRKINLGPSSGTDRIEVKLQPGSAPATAPPPPPEPLVKPPNVENPGPPPSSSNRPPRIDSLLIGGIAALAMGAVSFGVAIGFGGDLASNNSTRDALCPGTAPCRFQSAFDADHTARLDQQWMFVTGTIGVIGMGGGAALVVASVIGHKSSKEKSAQRIDVRPWTSPSGAGLSFGGVW